VYARILIGVIAVTVIAISFSYHLASAVVGKQQSFEQQVRQWTADRTTITEIHTIDEYRGKKTYAVVTGKNKSGTKVAAWMTSDDLVFGLLEKAVSREKVTELVMKENAKANIKNIVLGLDGEQRFWEVVFVDHEQRYNYAYYDFYSGKKLKSYKLSPIHL